MNMISLIIKREYLTRVKKKSFIVMTILGPIFMAALIIAPILIERYAKGDNEQKVIAVVDDSMIYKSSFKDSEGYKFIFLDEPVDSIKNHLEDRNFYGVLHIPATKVMLPENAVLYSVSQVPLDVKDYLKGIMRSHIEDVKLKASGIDKDILATTKANINFSTIKITEDGDEQESFAEVAMGIGFISSLIIYMFIFMFGSQVMRGVFEEKSNRIVEIIISSVKPFQLMMGKIIGVALVGLTQVFLWIILTFAIYSVFTSLYSDTLSLKPNTEMVISQGNNIASDNNIDMMDEIQNSVSSSKVFEIINSINFGVIIGGFLFYFLGGYLLYSALFAAIGSAVDNETDTQQFMLPITIPLIIAIIAAQVVIKNPEGSLAFWLSIIPFTSPIIMMVRLPFGVPYLDVILSAVFLILGFIFTTWLAGRIYRVGILMYGKKVNYKELWKWIRFKG